MHGLILADVGNDWSLSGSVETFAIPIGLFIVVAAVLFVLFSRPHAVPGHRDLAPAAGGQAPASGRAGTAPDAGDGS